MMKQRNPEARCVNCPYWGQPDAYEGDDVKFASCQRFPPFARNRVNVPGYRYMDYDHVETAEWDSCGEHPEFFLPDLLELPIEQLHLDNRTYNALRMAKCRQVGQLTRLRAVELRQLHGLGAKGIESIRAALMRLGLSLLGEEADKC